MSDGEGILERILDTLEELQRDVYYLKLKMRELQAGPDGVRKEFEKHIAELRDEVDQWRNYRKD